ncbi:MAG: class I SAM-dependent methyltransferase [Brevundimonas sp.]|uniref:SAM-dependent methyltransferase n=1 Tax=Brevundimonas sp. TaxID=1871086 RepID=UPI00271C2D35|nr:class I SAM-dependent methyltransferase [Brevundimonas sp.]MDO9587448.1 class I SAM-dependent methyltransferase [Brevundimonas sp.]MDP3655462.1 class I SAM-dependent methyltransferase [Brevundimonas sp.]MDZ4110862.1 class I SAM-dependent methyltransferase [Brevundimonas sp.]
MTLSFQRIAYEALNVCNGVTMAALEAAVERTGLAPGAAAIDIGTGNAAVAVRLAERFGLRVTAIEFDPVMADLARQRIDAAGAGAEVTLAVAGAADVLARSAPVDLIVALGTTNVTGEGRPTPEAGFTALRRKLRPGGWLLWGDIVWLAEPPAPLRQITEATNLYTDDAGWRAAATGAGFEVITGRISDPAEFEAYPRDAVTAVRAWLEAHPDAPEAASIRFHADRVQAITDFGRDYIGFGVYLLRNPD